MANAVTTNGYEEGGGNASNSGARPPRLPRWTRQEILVLIQGKKVAESRGRGRVWSRAHHIGSAATAGLALVGSGHPVEPKWATVSSYCRRHGVNRGPVQCRKRWSNLAGDYKKIKEWECRRGSDGGGEESFWILRNDLRRERKLPGFFDREVYDILDGAVEGEAEEEEEAAGRRGGTAAAAAAAVEEEEAIFDSGRTAGEDGLFSDFEQEDEGEENKEEEEERRPPVTPAAAVMPISEKEFQPFYQGPTDLGMTNEKQPAENLEKGSTSQEGHKRKRTLSEEDEGTNMQNRLIEVLERNNRMLTAQLEAQNINCQLDRDQRKDHADSLVGVLSKLADALGRIADKL